MSEDVNHKVQLSHFLTSLSRSWQQLNEIVLNIHDLSILYCFLFMSLQARDEENQALREQIRQLEDAANSLQDKVRYETKEQVRTPFIFGL
jgi:hypothetical protein